MQSGLLLPSEVASLFSQPGVDDLGENLRLRPLAGVDDGSVLYVSKASLR
jgi:hypothetical protein